MYLNSPTRTIGIGILSLILIFFITQGGDFWRVWFSKAENGTNENSGKVECPKPEIDQMGKYKEIMDKKTTVSDKIDQLVKLHTEYVNCLFNKAIEEMKKMTQYKGENEILTEDYDYEKIKPKSPNSSSDTYNSNCSKNESSANTQDKQCYKYCIKKNNISQTACIAWLAVEDYKEFHDRMLGRWEWKNSALLEVEKYGLKNQIIENMSQEEKKGLDAQGFLTKTALLQIKIDQEVEYAFKALDFSLRAYEEMRTAYPLHYMLNGKKNNDSLVKNLEKYRDKFKELRKKIEILPPKFKNATTTQC